MKTKYLFLKLDQAAALEAEGMPENAVTLYDALLSVFASRKLAQVQGHFFCGTEKLQKLCGFDEWFVLNSARDWLVNNGYVSYEKGEIKSGKAATWKILKTPFKRVQTNLSTHVRTDVRTDTQTALDTIYGSSFVMPEDIGQMNQWQENYIRGLACIVEALNNNPGTTPMDAGNMVYDILLGQSFMQLRKSRGWARDIVNSVLGDGFLEQLYATRRGKLSEYMMIERYKDTEDGCYVEPVDRDCTEREMNVMNSFANAVTNAVRSIKFDGLADAQINNVYWSASHLRRMASDRDENGRLPEYKTPSTRDGKIEVIRECADTLNRRLLHNVDRLEFEVLVKACRSVLNDLNEIENEKK